MLMLMLMMMLVLVLVLVLMLMHVEMSAAAVYLIILTWVISSVFCGLLFAIGFTWVCHMAGVGGRQAGQCSCDEQKALLRCLAFGIL